MSNPFDYAPKGENVNLDKIKDLFEWLRLSGHDYSILQSEGVLGGKSIAFSKKDGNFYTAPRKKISEEQFFAILPYLRWAHDQVVDEIAEVEEYQEYTTKSGNKSTRKIKKEVKTGRKINQFPPTPENILAMRHKLETQFLKEGKSLVQDQAEYNQLLGSCVPRLADHERIEAIKESKGYTKLERIARKLETMGV